MTINEMLEKKTEEFGNKTSMVKILKHGTREYSYKNVYNHVTKVSKYLTELGIGKGDHIAILGENTPEWAISYFSILWMGCIAVPLDARGDMETTKYILNFSYVKALFVSASFEKQINDILNELETVENVISMESFDNIVSKYEAGTEKTDVSTEDLCEILFTSGTTGNPKGVMLTHGNIMSNIEDIYSFLYINPDDRILSILPINHVYEKTGGLLTTFYSGLTIYYGSGVLKPREMLEDLKAVRPTVWLNTPLVLEKLYLRIKKELENQKGIKGFIIKLLPKRILGRRIRKELGLDKLKLLVSGGAALPKWVSDGLEELGFKIIQGYGLSEASPLVSANPPAKPKNESVGMIIPSDEVEIRDTDSEGNGEIYAKGPNIMKGYYSNPDATNEVFTSDGWLKTGDVGFFDEEGYLYITGRKKYLIVTPGGKNIFPEEIEEKFLKSSFIEEIMIFSPNDREIQAIVYPNLDGIKSKLNKYEINFEDDEVWNLIENTVKQINKGLKSYKKVSKFAIKTEEFPKTSTRKIKRFIFKNFDLNNKPKYI